LNGAHQWKQAGGELVGCRDLHFPTEGACSCEVSRVAEFAAIGSFRRQSRLGQFGDQTPLLFRQRGVEVQHKRIGVSTEFGHDKRHPLRHQSGHKGQIAREPVELGHQDATLGAGGRSQCSRKSGGAENNDRPGM
jgi:hypothetical protein